MDDTTLALECCECLATFDTIEDADQHLRDDDHCARAQGHFNIVVVH